MGVPGGVGLGVPVGEAVEGVGGRAPGSGVAGTQKKRTGIRVSGQRRKKVGQQSEIVAPNWPTPKKGQREKRSEHGNEPASGRENQRFKCTTTGLVSMNETSPELQKFSRGKTSAEN